MEKFSFQKVHLITNTKFVNVMGTRASDKTKTNTMLYNKTQEIPTLNICSYYTNKWHLTKYKYTFLSTHVSIL
jgi:hypothetical protein